MGCDVLQMICGQMMCRPNCVRPWPQGQREVMRDGGAPGAAGHGERGSGWGPRSPANPEFLGHGTVALGVLLAKVLEQPAALADQHEQAAPGVMVLLVGLEVVGEAVDALGQEGD